MAKTVELWCQNGKHKWTRASQRGRRPLHCPEHQPVVVSNGEPGSGLERAREIRRSHRDDEIWKYVESYQKMSNCSCDLHKGMTHDDLDELPPCGCVDSNRYICPALAAYRRLLPDRPVSEEEQALLEEVSI